jgi:Rhodanese-like domain
MILPYWEVRGLLLPVVPSERSNFRNQSGNPTLGVNRFALYQNVPETMVETISREDLKAKMDRGDDFVLVETLSEKQYRHTHLPGALNLPPDRVREVAPELLPDKEADIVVYCGSPA